MIISFYITTHLLSCINKNTQSSHFLPVNATDINDFTWKWRNKYKFWYTASNIFNLANAEFLSSKLNCMKNKHVWFASKHSLHSCVTLLKMFLTTLLWGNFILKRGPWISESRGLEAGGVWFIWTAFMPTGERNNGLHLFSPRNHPISKSWRILTGCNFSTVLPHPKMTTTEKVK